MSLSARYGDPVLDTIARSIFTLFPRCVECGGRIDRLEEAEVRILTNRVAHAGGCPVKQGHRDGAEGQGRGTVGPGDVGT